MSEKGYPHADEYRLPSLNCATCGRPSSSRRRKGRESWAGYGDFHYSCRRENGRLLVWDEVLKRERPA